MKLVSMSLAGVLAGLALPAYKKAAAPGGATEPAAAKPGAAAPPIADRNDEAEGEKLHAAIECLNWLSGNLFEARDRYLEGVDKAGTPAKGRKPVMMGLRSIDPCVRAVKRAGAIKPAVPTLDAASAGYATAIEGFRKAFEELNGYYQKDEHLDDKGKPTASEYENVSRNYNSLVTNYNNH
jgi:hypothetical protein